MENQENRNYVGVEMKNNASNIEKGSIKNGCDLLVRILCLITCLTSSIIMGTAKQSKVIQLKVLPTMPPLSVPVTAKSQQLSAFKFCMVTNAIACSYAAFSLLICMTIKSRNKKISMIITLVDLLMMALLFSSTGAAGAIGIMGRQGNTHVQWKKVCNVFDKFCNIITVAFGFSLLGSSLFLLLVFLNVFKFQQRSKC